MKQIIQILAFFLLSSFFMTQTEQPPKILVFGGKTGYLGKKIFKTLKDLGCNPVCALSRLENSEGMRAEIEDINPDYIINAAGLAGKQTIDWFESNKQEAIRINLIGTLNLIDIAYTHNIHITNISTGSFYKYDDKHPIASGIGFTEEEEPNFRGPFYSELKVILEKILLNYPNVLNLRVTMPVSVDFDPKNFIIRLSRYKKVMNVPFCLTVLDDLLPIAIDMTLKKRKGIYNFINPGTITHNELLDLYREYIDPEYKYENFSVIDQIKILQSGRSNCELSVAKLLKEYPHMPYLKDSLKKVFEHMRDLQNNNELKS